LSVTASDTTTTANERMHPGEINNNKLIYDFRDFFNDGNFSNPDNLVIRHDLDYNKSAKMIHVTVWNYFKEIYSGGPEIICQILEEKKNSMYARRYVELYISKFNLCFLPRRAELNSSSINKILVKPTFLSKKKYVSDLKEKISKIYGYNFSSNLINTINGNGIGNKTNRHNSFKINSQCFRLWKLNIDSSLENIKYSLNSLIKDKERKLIDSNSISYIECMFYL
jgi:hypothetical protein